MDTKNDVMHQMSIKIKTYQWSHQILNNLNELY